MNDETPHQKRERLAKVRETYNYVSKAMGHGRGVPQYKPEPKNQFEPLTVHSDVQNYIRRLNESIVLSNPQSPTTPFHRQTRALTSRVNKFNGSQINTILKSPPVLITQSKAAQIHILTEKEAITPENPHKMPSLEPPPTFVLPDDVFPQDDALKKKNDFNRLLNKINEENRDMFNSFAKEMNIREKKREEIIRQRYKDCLDFGAEESKRRSKRRFKLEMLKEEKQELEWWLPFVETFQPETRGMHDLDCVEMLSKCSSFSEFEIMGIYRKGVYKSPVAKEIYKQTLKAANEFGNFIPQNRLNFVFKAIEEEHAAIKQIRT